MMKRLSLISWLFCSYLCGQNNVATTSGAFLEIGPGARALGMGSAYVSVANDASTLYWNPAGMVNISNPEIQTFILPGWLRPNFIITRRWCRLVVLEPLVHHLLQ